MEAFLLSVLAVTVAEMGDKTQLLAFILAVKFRKPVPIVLGILAATLLNHALAGVVGTWLASLLSPEILRWILGLSFIAMAIWSLIPDQIEAQAVQFERFGVFATTLIVFFLAEMGDKTQIATVALAARYQDFFWVVAGTTLGMLIADVPAVYLGDRLAQRIPVRLVQGIAAGIFAIIGIATLLGIGRFFGF